MLLGLVGVTAFGLTLPATKIAVAELDPIFIGVGRSAVAGIIAAVLLWASASKRPNTAQLLQLSLVAIGVVLGFPLMSALGMQTLPASHGGVMLAILPLLTAAIATYITGEKNSRLFWICSLLAGLLVIAYAARNGLDSWKPGDWWLSGAVILAAWGYAVGGQLSKQLGGWQVICWALVLTLPITIPVSLWLRPSALENISVLSWSSFLYLCLISQLLGFFAWNRGLALGGVTRVSQVQLIQPFITLLASSWLLGEILEKSTLLCAALVVGLVFVGYRKR
ncbi:hypothetical protein BGP75_13195 [Motiliproteus sp. MSK22-1]|nr:hypothetical protein BGP75_13195 [Motiliproteus sp. MSK22-1]